MEQAERRRQPRTDAHLLYNDCTKCGTGRARRVAEMNPLDRLLARFGLYPWFCVGCKRRYFLRERHG